MSQKIGVVNDAFESDSDEQPISDDNKRHNGAVPVSSSSEQLREKLTSDNEETRKGAWDVFRTFSLDTSNENIEAFYEFCNKVFRLLAIIVIFAVLLGCAVMSKSTLLYATSQLRTRIELDCKTSSSAGNEVFCMGKPITNSSVKYNTSCLHKRPGMENVLLEQKTVCSAVTIRWVWSLFLMIVTPYVLVFFRNVWLVCFKFEKTPPADVLLFVLIQETLYCVGMSIFTFRVLPYMNDVIQSLAVMAAVGFFPGLLRIFLRPPKVRLWILQLLLDIAAFGAQISALILLPVLATVKPGEFDPDFKWAVPVSLVLMSLSWWENYVDKDTKLGPLTVALVNFKVKIRKFRTKAYLVASVWKILLTFLLLLAFASKHVNVVDLFNWDFSKSRCGGNAIGPLDIPSMEWDWLALWGINTGVGIAAYFMARTAAKVKIQRISFAIPLILSTPAVFASLVGMCESWNNDPCVHTSVIPGHAYWRCYPRDGLGVLFTENHKWLFILWWLSQVWITRHMFFPSKERLLKTERIFLLPLWDNIIIEQWLMHNRSRRDENKKTGTNILEREGAGDEALRETSDALKGQNIRKEDSIPFIYICATMWHETETEMVNLLKSLFRLDIDQCARRMAQLHMQLDDPDYYKFEAHIFFDDAMQDHLLTQHKYKCNQFVKLLVSVVEGAAQDIHGSSETNWIDPPEKYPTPYGGRLIWTMPGGNKIIAHLKDKAKIRHKKRWSQVMYMYYFLAYKLWAHESSATRKQIKADNCYLLALDGDVDFQPEALLKLVDMMRKDENMGAACGRIHPTGSGPMVWYQMFEYALGHWMQKATEHVLGCVLCSPGCFSLFRGSALMDHNVMKKYTTMSSEAVHYVQYDQGEDRWLCTLLLQQGYRVQYSAASDSYTFAPEGFNEFYNQRRRWLPSTMANILDLLKSWRHTINVNRNISMLFIIYQAILFIAAVLGSGAIFLMIVGAVQLALRGAISNWASFTINLIPIILFVIICFKAKSSTQLIVAQVLTTIYALVQMLVLVGIAIQISDDGPCSPTAIFFFLVSGVFIFAAIIHPQEFVCVMHGFIYFVSIPSMYMLLMIYSLTNLNVVSWGTREVKPTPSEEAEAAKKEQEAEVNTPESEGTNKIMAMINKVSQELKQDKGWSATLGSWCRCTCCPRPAPSEDSVKFEAILSKLEDMEGKVKSLEHTVRHGGNMPQVVEHKATIQKDTEEVSDQSKVSSGGKMTVHAVKKRDKLKYNETTNPFWINDDDLGKGDIIQMDEAETYFFKDLISSYLFPLEKNKAQEERVAMELLDLRNKVSFAFLLLNACFIVVVFTLQANTDKVSVTWPCGQNLRLEPIGFLFLIFFGFIMFLQTMGMVIHRTGTFLHIIATTDVNFFKSKKGDTFEDQLQLAREMVRLQDDEAEEDARRGSIVSVAEDKAQPGIKRNMTVKKLARQERARSRKSTVAKNADEAFKLRLEKLNSELAKNEDEQSAADIAKKVMGGGRKSRKSIRAISNYKKGRDRCQTVPDLAEEEEEEEVGATAKPSSVPKVSFRVEKDDSHLQEQSQL